MQFCSALTKGVVWRARPSCIAGGSAYCPGHIKAGRAGNEALHLNPTSCCRAHTLAHHVIDASRDVVWCSSHNWDKETHNHLVFNQTSTHGNTCLKIPEIPSQIFSFPILDFVSLLLPQHFNDGRFELCSWRRALTHGFVSILLYKTGFMLMSEWRRNVSISSLVAKTSVLNKRLASLVRTQLIKWNLWRLHEMRKCVHSYDCKKPTAWHI